MTDEITQTRPSQATQPADNPGTGSIDTIPGTGSSREISDLPADSRQQPVPGTSRQLSAEKQTGRTEAEQTSRPANPLEMPYEDVAPDSKEYQDWRKVQHRHGMRNLIVALVVFGTLAILYWVFVHNI